MSKLSKLLETIAALRDIRPAAESLHDVARSNFKYGMVGKNEMVPIDKLTGGVSTAADDARRVDELFQQMSGPQGYVERLIADDAGNVVEGQHRLDALRRLQAREVPVSRLHDLSRPYDVQRVERAIAEGGVKHPDQITQLAREAFESAFRHGGPAKVLAEREMPAPYTAAYEAALKQMLPINTFHGSTERNLKRIDPRHAIETRGATFHATNPDVAETFTFPREYGEMLTYDPATGRELKRGRVYETQLTPKKLHEVPATDAQRFIDDSGMQAEVVKEARGTGHDAIVARDVKEGIGERYKGDVYGTFTSDIVKILRKYGVAAPLAYPLAGPAIDAARGSDG